MEQNATDVMDAPPRQKTVFSKKHSVLEISEKALAFISQQVDLVKYRPVIISPSGKHIYESTDADQIRTIIDLQSVNQHKNLNSYFRWVNHSLPDAGIYIGCVETYAERKERFNRKFTPFFSTIIWAFDFIINRVLPKCYLTKDMYSFFSGGRYPVISKAEILGRLCYSGFEVIGHETINNLLYFSVIKTSEPKVASPPRFGIFIKMKRISKKGKIIGVFKIRTMHPYSEYLQEYVVKMNGYNAVGKPNEDFRLTRWGKMIRKLHLDELPQLLNVIKGELNIVGVRPISRFGYESLPKDLQQERIKYKPGCIPPNVSLGIKGFEGVIKAERKYLRDMRTYGLITNYRYFVMALFNLIIKRNLSA